MVAGRGESPGDAHGTLAGVLPAVFLLRLVHANRKIQLRPRKGSGLAARRDALGASTLQRIPCPRTGSQAWTYDTQAVWLFTQRGSYSHSRTALTSSASAAMLALTVRTGGALPSGLFLDGLLDVECGPGDVGCDPVPDQGGDATGRYTVGAGGVLVDRALGLCYPSDPGLPLAIERRIHDPSCLCPSRDATGPQGARDLTESSGSKLY